MTDNQDSVTAGAVQPPTDRPLTAGDVFHFYESRMIAGMAPSTAVWVDARGVLYEREDGERKWADHNSDHDITFVARPATSAASEGEGVEPWEPAAEAMCAEVIKRAEVTCRKATDELYEGLLYSVQDYLRENVTLNLSGELERAHGYERDARTALVEIAKAAGVDFVDSRDGVERQKERILAALASPPVSERERELEGALGLIADGWDVIESSGSMGEMTLQAPDDWEGDQTEIVVKFHGLTAQPQEPV